MKTRTIAEIFARPIADAAGMEWVHPRIQSFPVVEDKRRFINSLFGAGRINGSARCMLLDFYVEGI